MEHLTKRLGAALAATLLVASCGIGNPGVAPDSDALLPGGISSAARAAFDSASSAFVEGDLLRASELFASVIAEDSTLAAAWVGLYMAEQAMGQLGRTDSALTRALALMEPPPRRRGRGAASPGT